MNDQADEIDDEMDEEPKEETQPPREPMPFDALIAKGFKVFMETEWIGEPGVDRREIPTDRVRGVHAHLSPEEWCAMNQSEGDHYIGPCCGNSGAMQDIMAGVFREGGYIAAGDLSEIGWLGETHESADDELLGVRIGGAFGIRTRAKFDEVLSKWDRLSPWGKFGLAYTSLEAKLTLSRNLKPDTAKWHDGKRRDALGDERAFQTLAGALRYLEFETFFNRNEDPDGQHMANMSQLFARVLPATRVVLRLVEKRFKPFEGFALVHNEDPNTILKNGYGLCIYNNTEAPKKIADIMAKHEATLADKLLVRPVRVTVESGVELQ